MIWTPSKGEMNADRPDVRAELGETERQAIRDGAALLLSEDGSASKVAKLWNAAGVFSVYGLPWVDATVLATLKRPALGGYLVHGGKVVGKLEGEPILTQRTHDRLQA